jgi:pyridoxamine 5'-phosphate oxidase
VSLYESDAAPDPLAQFHRWYAEADAADVPFPDTMALATATPDGAPSLRMVLLKGADERGVQFFTNYESRKGGELQRNPRAALLFYWQPLGRQVRIEGEVVRVDRDETEVYARARTRASQLSALASPQSRVIPDRDWLEERVAELAAEHAGGADVPVPETWGGFRVVPDVYEFWEDGPDRLHDRLRYRRDGAGAWVIERLAP